MFFWIQLSRALTQWHVNCCKSFQHPRIPRNFTYPNPNFFWRSTLSGVIFPLFSENCLFQQLEKKCWKTIFLHPNELMDLVNNIRRIDSEEKESQLDWHTLQKIRNNGSKSIGIICFLIISTLCFAMQTQYLRWNFNTIELSTQIIMNIKEYNYQSIFFLHNSKIMNSWRE